MTANQRRLTLAISDMLRTQRNKLGIRTVKSFGPVVVLEMTSHAQYSVAVAKTTPVTKAPAKSE